MKQVYMITYPTGKIYIGKDLIGSFRYFGSPNMDVVNADFESLPREQQLDYSDADVNAKEVEFIRKYESNNPEGGYNRWPKYMEVE